MANIEKRGENSYRFTVYLPKNADGKYPKKRKAITVEGKYTPKQLKEYLDREYLKFKDEVLSGSYVLPEKMLFSAFANEWLEKFARKELSSTTFVNYESKLMTNILPVIGHVRMDEINTMMLQSLMDGLRRKDGSAVELSFYTKFDVYRTLRSIFKYAVQWKVLVKNPLEGVTKPKNRNKKEVSAYDEEEVAVIFKALNDELFKWRIFAMLAITAGIRRGENLALEWSDIDFENSRIDIHQSIVSADGKTEIKDTKTDSSNRLVSLPTSVVEELRKYRVYWAQEKLKAKNWTETEREWLFHQRNGTYVHPSSATHWWNKFAKKLSIRYIRLHDLRHTSASLLIAQGVHAKIISERLGHANIKITMDTYGHALRSADQAAADTFESLFQPKSINK
ncbi:site-specific integrase [Psychrobacillus sp. Sa2BUA9]|uniref:Site-specific integrase n=1 Tax=Psychrobacillus faecigallinarum TaxID=2762235 RepID=A0ABR8R410_9BACI|nr:site-specific integrase [Psychrobacillus faecigallinarum]MBD7942519.1 site-specific integrase [Psychrobacillus faecigallinarum]